MLHRYSRETVLGEFTDFIGDARCAVYPGSCSVLRFKCVVDVNDTTYGGFV